MNERIKRLEAKCWEPRQYGPPWFNVEKYTKLIVEETLTQVAERAYYTGDRDWSDDIDRPWIQLEFGYGKLADAQKGVFK